jgi:hypothetical protein
MEGNMDYKNVSDFELRAYERHTRNEIHSLREDMQMTRIELEAIHREMSERDLDLTNG